MRSFDALRFMRVLDHGIVWRGMTATYPPLVPTYHVKAARLSMMRLSLLEGRISYLPESASPEERDFAVSQSKKGTWLLCDICALFLLVCPLLTRIISNAQARGIAWGSRLQ